MADLNEKVKALRASFLECVAEELDTMDATLESPIERAFLWAYCCQRQNVEGYGWLPTFDLPGSSPEGGACCVGARTASGVDMELWSQVPVHVGVVGYRLDFVLTARSGSVRVLVDVELDGHDFHERTKEQAERDKKRDRDVQSIGYHVARFTGAQVYRDPRGVAEEAMGFALGLLRLRVEQGV